MRFVIQLGCTVSRRARNWHARTPLTTGYFLLSLLFALAGHARGSTKELPRPCFFDPPGNLPRPPQKGPSLDEKIAKFSKLIREQADDARAHYDRGRCYADLQDFEKAARDFEKAISLGLHESWAFGANGTAHLLCRSFDKALVAYSRAIELGLADPRVYIARGYASLMTGRVSAAYEDFTRAIAFVKDDQDLADSYYLRGKSCIVDEQWDKAVADLTEAIKLNGKDSPYFVWRATAFGKLGLIDEAIRDCNTALKLDPKDHFAYTERGSAFRRRKDFKQALADYNEAIQLEPAQWRHYANRAATYYAVGDLRSAISDCDMVFILNPSCAPIERLRERCMKELGK